MVVLRAVFMSFVEWLLKYGFMHFYGKHNWQQGHQKENIQLSLAVALFVWITIFIGRKAIPVTGRGGP
jgi:hypothetical protein